MSGLNAFLAEESGVDETPPESADLTPETPESEVPAGAEQVATPEGDQGPDEPEAPPEGLDKRSEAIWREERTKRKELQAQVDKMNDRWATMVERMQAGQIQQPAAQPEQAQSKPSQEIEVPDFEEDPIGHLRAKNEILERQLNEVNQERVQSKQERQQNQQFEQLRTGVKSMEDEFAATTPDYHDAVGYLYGNVAKMAQAMGYPPAQIQQAVTQTAMDITARSIQAGKNPAQAAYEAAKAMGYTVAAPVDPADDVDDTPRKSPPTSLSSVAGKRSTGVPSLDAIADMSDEDFDSMWAKMEKAARKS